MSDETITKAHLLSDTHDNFDVNPFPYTNESGHTHHARCHVNFDGEGFAPGAFKMYKLINDSLPDTNSNRVYVNGIGPWTELSSTNRTYHDAQVEFVDAFVYTLDTQFTPTPTWNRRIQWGGTDIAGHGYAWNSPIDNTSDVGGEMTYQTRNSHTCYGWGSTSIPGYTHNGTLIAFGADIPDDGSNDPNHGFVRIHSWPLDWTGGSGNHYSFFWASQDPTRDDAAANRTIGNSVLAIAWGVKVRVVGPGAASTSYVIQSGIDHLYEGAPTVGLPAGSREGTGGRLRAIPSNGDAVWATGHTLSDAQLDAYPPPFMDVTPPPPAPSITAISPVSGSTAGGTILTITGTGFTGATSVKFGLTNASSFTVNSSTSITATAPVHTAGAVFVTVTTPDGTSASVAASSFTFSPPSPPAGTTTIAAAFVNSSGTPISTLETGGRWYVEVESIGTGTTTLTSRIYGTIFSNWTSFLGGADTLEVWDGTAWSTVEGGPWAFGPGANNQTGTYALDITSPLTITHDTITRISGISTGPGVANLIFHEVNGDSTSNTVSLSLTISTTPPAPTITLISPSSASTGDSIVITGTSFTTAIAVSFGGTSASFTIDSSTQITAIAPTHANGAVNVTVTNPGGTSSGTHTFTFISPPVVVDPVLTSLTPNTGAPSDFIVIAGTGLTNVTDIKFGTTSSPGFTVDSAIQITVLVPSGTAGSAVVVTAIDPTGTSNGLVFTYDASIYPSTVEARFVTCPAGATPANKLTQFLTDVTTFGGSTDFEDTYNYLQTLSTVTSLAVGEDYFFYWVVQVPGDVSGSGNSGLLTWDAELGSAATIGPSLSPGHTLSVTTDYLYPDVYIFIVFGTSPTGYNPAALMSIDFETDDGAILYGYATVAVGTAPVLSDPPHACFLLYPDIGPATLHVDTDAACSTDDVGIASYDWNWGDGSAPSSGITSGHDYDTPGTYTVTLTVYDDDAQYDTETHVVTVLALEQPVACFTVTPDHGFPTLDVVVDATCSTDSDGVIVSYDWDFGDPTSDTNVTSGITSTHSYANPGTYIVTLRVVDDDGLTNIATRTVFVEAAPLPLAIHALAGDPVFITLTTQTPG